MSVEGASWQVGSGHWTCPLYMEKLRAIAFAKNDDGSLTLSAIAVVGVHVFLKDGKILI